MVETSRLASIAYSDGKTRSQNDTVKIYTCVQKYRPANYFLINWYGFIRIKTGVFFLLVFIKSVDGSENELQELYFLGSIDLFVSDVKYFINLNLSL